MSRRHLVLGALAGLVLALAAALAVVLNSGQSQGGAGVNFSLPADVQLVDQAGRAFTAERLKGRPTALFFGFTYCPEICPTTLTDLMRWREALGERGRALNIVFVTIDPERDTPAQMASYVASFPGVTGVTGTPAAIEKAAKGFRVFYRKTPTEGGDYTMDHSTVIYLLDKRGRFVAPIGYQEPDERAIAKLKSLVGG